MADSIVYMRPGSTCRITLDAGRNAGCRWHVISAEGLGWTEEYIRKPGPKKLFGTGGCQRFEITAGKPGEYLFEAECARGGRVSARECIKIMAGTVAAPESTMEMILGKEKTTLESIKTAVGEEHEVWLRSNPTTGFSWNVVSDGGLVCRSSYVPDPAPEGICGSGGRHRFVLTSEKPGTHRFAAVYARPWELEKDPGNFSGAYVLDLEAERDRNTRIT